MAALDAANAALALGLPTIVSARMSAADPRPRHVGLSHHTRSVLELLLRPVAVPVPEELGELWPESGGLPPRGSIGPHPLLRQPVDLDGYAGSGLPIRTMGRHLHEDPLFFAAPLAAGVALGKALPV